MINKIKGILNTAFVNLFRPIEIEKWVIVPSLIILGVSPFLSNLLVKHLPWNISIIFYIILIGLICGVIASLIRKGGLSIFVDESGIIFAAFFRFWLYFFLINKSLFDINNVLLSAIIGASLLVIYMDIIERGLVNRLVG